MCVSRNKSCNRLAFRCQLGSILIIIVRLFGLVAAAKRPQCIACWVSSGVVGCARPLPVHLVEKIGPKDPKSLSLLNGE